MKAAIIFSISALLIAGCNPGPNIYGHWEGNRDWKAFGTQDEAVSRALAAVNLDLKPDGTFVLTEGGVPFEGKFALVGDSLQLDVLTILRKPISVQPQVTRSAALYEAKLTKDQILIRTGNDSKWLPLKKVKEATPAP